MRRTHCLEQLSQRFPITSETRGRTNYWLAGFGSLVEVVGPEGLRAEFREEARRLFRSYDVNHVGQ